MTIYQHQGEKVYFDSCCIGRNYDALPSAEMNAEAQKIQEIIDNQALGGYSIIGSMVVTSEIGEIDDDEKREALEKIYYDTVAGEAELSLKSIARADVLHTKGLGVMDSYHLAVAEAADVDFLLTTDKDFIKVCAKPNFTPVRVINPLDF